MKKFTTTEELDKEVDTLIAKHLGEEAEGMDKFHALLNTYCDLIIEKAELEKALVKQVKRMNNSNKGIL